MKFDWYSWALGFMQGAVIICICVLWGSNEPTIKVELKGRDKNGGLIIDVAIPAHNKILAKWLIENGHGKAFLP